MLDDTKALAGNMLLATLSRADAALVSPWLENFEMILQKELYQTHQSIDFAYFPLGGICSVIAENAQGTRVETGLIGREGFVGIPIILFAEKASSRIIVQAPGRALRMSSTKLLEAIELSRSFHKLLLQFAHVFSVQVTQAAISNAHNTIQQRVARWFLMCQDRADAREFPMTHEFLSKMIDVRRAGVTDALASLEGIYAIKALRNRVIILDRSILEEIAGGSYSVAEKEYARLIPA
ncbi:MAG TPA: Crp/Fnr family transcriptional regulator [Aestuariivirga sp.]|nr:Crp/Fnr family transcriptional regulator [Aestuariivirga sp.]